MDYGPTIEAALNEALSRASGHGGYGAQECPPKLAAAMRYAVVPGGARLRPRLCLAVCEACGERPTRLALSAASAIELLHCASLVHDDLPAFDDAETRRGKPSVHAAFGEPLAILVGDALIVLAFEVLGRSVTAMPERAARLIATVAGAVGAPCGITAGQAWECEEVADLTRYHRLKTGAMFQASVVAGAQAAGADPGPWRTLGAALGEAYQVADDIRDAAATEAEIGKPVLRDCALGRPSAVTEYGLGGAIERLDAAVGATLGAIPDCAGAGALRALLTKQTKRFLPEGLARTAA